jgi:hypothetical protein
MFCHEKWVIIGRQNEKKHHHDNHDLEVKSLIESDCSIQGFLKLNTTIPDNLKKFKKLAKMNSIKLSNESFNIIILKNLVELYFDNIMPKKYMITLKSISSKLIDDFMKIFDVNYILVALNIPPHNKKEVRNDYANVDSFLNIGSNMENILEKYSFSSETSNASSMLFHKQESLI